MKRLYLVIDNVLIHTPVRGRELVDNTGYKCCLYLPPYSPFLNPFKKILVQKQRLRLEEIYCPCTIYSVIALRVGSEVLLSRLSNIG